MLIVDKNSWHCKVYQWWYTKKYGYPKEGSTSNLCPYMRAIMFWAPLRLLFTDAISFGRVPLGAFTVPAIVLPLPWLAGYLDYNLKIAFAIIYSIVAVCGVASGLIYLFSSGGLNAGKPFRNASHVVVTSSFADLIREYLKSAHDRVCPEVHF